MTADVEGNVLTRPSVCVGADGLLYEFKCDESGRLLEVAVSTWVAVEDFASTLEPGEEGRPPTVRFRTGETVYRRLLSALQALESNLAFSTGGALERIRWDRPTQQRIAENASEEDSILGRDFKVSYAYPRNSVTFDPLMMRELLVASPDLDSLVVPKAFLREGFNEFGSFRYIQAFYSFFFVLESCFAGGKSGLKQVMAEFLKSEELARITRYAIKETRRDERHAASLADFYAEEKCGDDLAGTYELLLKVRGNLHHFYARSTKRVGTPFNQEDFRTIAWLVMRSGSAGDDAQGGSSLAGLRRS